MNLSLFLAIGEGLEDFQSKGQLKRLVNYNIKKYSQNFEKVYVFSYGQQQYKLPKNCTLITNDYKIHRYLYSLLLPIINYSYITKSDVVRGLQLTGGIPATVSKIIFHKKFAINFGYDYSQFAKIEKKYLQSIFYKLIKFPILSLSDSVIVPSKTIYKTLKKEFGKKVVYIPNGVDTKLFRPQKRTEGRKLSVVYIGRLEAQKNLTSLLKALKLLKIPTTVTFYGEGSQKKSLNLLAKKLGLTLKIKPPVDYEEVARVLRQSDIFALPSLKEGSPKILLEAMASECAIIASNIEEISEIVSNNQTALLSESDYQSLAKEIVKLKDLKIRQKLGKNARKSAKENYEINKLLENEVKILKSLK